MSNIYDSVTREEALRHRLHCDSRSAEIITQLVQFLDRFQSPDPAQTISLLSLQLGNRENELARVRGLLQRLEWSSADGDGYAMCPVCEAEGPVANCPADPHEADCWLAAEISGTPANEVSPTFPQSSSLVSQGAESADIGKLDRVDEKGAE